MPISKPHARCLHDVALLLFDAAMIQDAARDFEGGGKLRGAANLVSNVEMLAAGALLRGDRPSDENDRLAALLRISDGDWTKAKANAREKQEREASRYGNNHLRLPWHVLQEEEEWFSIVDADGNEVVSRKSEYPEYIMPRLQAMVDGINNNALAAFFEKVWRKP